MSLWLLQIIFTLTLRAIFIFFQPEGSYSQLPMTSQPQPPICDSTNLFENPIDGPSEANKRVKTPDETIIIEFEKL